MQGPQGGSVLYPTPDSQEEMGQEIQSFMTDFHPHTPSALNTKVGWSPT